MPKTLDDHTDRTGQSYEDSIQELNNLIGELDSFQREHETKSQRKLHSPHSTHESFESSSNVRPTLADLHSQLDKLSINGDVSSAIHSPHLLHPSATPYGADDDLAKLTDCYATTASLKKNLSTTEHPLLMRPMNGGPTTVHESVDAALSATSSASSASSSSASSATGVARSIEMIPDTFYGTDNYVKKNSEIVVLRRKNSQNDLTAAFDLDTGHLVVPDNGSAMANGERISSFRCSSFSGRLEPIARGPQTVQPIAESFYSVDTVDHTNGGHPPGLHDDMDADAMAQIRKKPVINPRPASLSGLFFLFFCFYC